MLDSALVSVMTNFDLAKGVLSISASHARSIHAVITTSFLEGTLLKPNMVTHGEIFTPPYLLFHNQRKIVVLILRNSDSFLHGNVRVNLKFLESAPFWSAIVHKVKP